MVQATDVESAKAAIAERKKAVAGSKLSYLWIIPLGKINSDSGKWFEIKGTRAAILRSEEAFRRTFTGDWVDVLLSPEDS